MVKPGGGGSKYGQRPSKTQSEARPAQPTYKPTYTGPEAHAAVPYGQPGYAPADTGAPRHKVVPKPPSAADLIWQNQRQAIGDDVLKKAASPGLATFHDILGMATGITPTVDAIRRHDALGTAAGAAMFFPFGKAFRGAKLLAEADHVVGSTKTVRTAEEATAHIDEVAARAKAEGHGGHVGGKGNPPLFEKGVVSDEHGGELGRQIREGLVRAPGIRTAQTAGYSIERSLRVKSAAEAGRKAGGGMAGHLATKRYLADALPKEFFGDWKHFTPEDIDHLVRVVDKAPLQLYEKTHVIDSIKNAVENGVVPTAGDHALMERVFGRVAGTATGKERLAGFLDKFVQATNIPRAIRSSGDISAGFRQLLTVLVTHPKVFARQWANGVKSFGSEEFYHVSQEAIHSDPFYPVAEKWGLPLTEIGSTVPKTEEAFIGAQVAERIPFGIGNIVRRSDRAFTGMVNGARFEMTKIMAEKAALLGRDLNDEHLGQSIARVAGTFTGRGVVPKVLESHLTTMNAAMFSPRLMASRLNLLSPVYYYKLDPFARREALAGARNLVGAIVTVMFVAKALGAEVEMDPRSSNFTKIKVGNTRIDIAGGYSQYIRLIAQEMTREAISSSGHKSHIGWGQNDTSDWSNVIGRFGRSKLAPIPSLLTDEGMGKDFIGQPVKQGHEAWSNAPFVAQDVRDAYKVSGPSSVVVAALLSAVGFGVQSYKDKPPADIGGSRPGRGSVYGGRPSRPSRP